MPLLTVTGYAPIEAHDNERLVLALERGGVDILHRCGGVARCTTCQVQFSAGEPTPMTEAERDKLAEKNLTGVRLSCQLLCTHDMTLSPVQTVRGSGLEAGKAPQAGIEPEPIWV
ncbi:2Fe-2S iron-sulfur cluster-binding protein [Deinococcus sp.]|uniref:2Fe-2S iron-sulfur cluster-binding protein n=1 Tax=Deinococcus sp. TaxID=47478 RepID=UPI0025ED0220|nr:2Fe-2S iron-sulfur cluster-binding protein [Deinococcus sp.]